MAELMWKMEPIFTFEMKFEDKWIDWCDGVWYTTFIISSIYILLVHPAKRWMAPREPFKLRVPLITWNFFIGVFSVVGTIRSLPVLVKAIQYDGFYSSMCETRYFSKDYVGIWGLLFVISKIPELIDTVFIILRKQKLIFLHWYHHASTLIFAWRMYSTRSSIAFWFCVMNYFVHSIMYTYYAMRSAGIRVNKMIAMGITTLQLSQMFMGMFAVFYAIYHKMYGVGCATEKPELILGVFIYTSYMILFAHFFFNAYIRPQRTYKSDDATSADGKKVTGVTKEVNGRSLTSKSNDILVTSTLTNGVRRR